MIERAGVEHCEMLARAGVGVLQDMPNYAGVPFDMNHTISQLKLFLPLPNLGCFFKQVDGEVVGFYMGIIAAPWFTPELEAAEIMFWVRPDYRKTDLAKRLIEVAEEWARDNHAAKILIAAGSGYRTEPVLRFYRRMGYHPFGTTTCKEL